MFLFCWQIILLILSNISPIFLLFFLFLKAEFLQCRRLLWAVPQTLHRSEKDGENTSPEFQSEEDGENMSTEFHSEEDGENMSPEFQSEKDTGVQLCVSWLRNPFMCFFVNTSNPGDSKEQQWCSANTHDMTETHSFSASLYLPRFLSPSLSLSLSLSVLAL